MPLPDGQRLRFFVYIVESPSAPDLYHRRYESDLLRQVLELEGIRCVARIAISRQALTAALAIGIYEEMKNCPGLLPIVHISAHGDSSGIELSDKTLITWAELRKLLQPINKAFDGGFLLTMSCCQGYQAIQMAMSDDTEDLPYFAVVGNYANPTWPETAVADASFYHLLAKGTYVTEAVNAMRAASGNDSFATETAEGARKGYLEYIQKLNAGEVAGQIEAAAAQSEQQQPAEHAKAAALESGGT